MICSPVIATPEKPYISLTFFTSLIVCEQERTIGSRIKPCSNFWNTTHTSLHKCIAYFTSQMYIRVAGNSSEKFSLELFFILLQVQWIHIMKKHCHYVIILFRFFKSIYYQVSRVSNMKSGESLLLILTIFQWFNLNLLQVILSTFETVILQNCRL